MYDARGVQTFLYDYFEFSVAMLTFRPNESLLYLQINRALNNEITNNKVYHAKIIYSYVERSALGTV